MSGSQTDSNAARLETLIARLPTRSPIYLPTQKLSPAEQVSGLQKVLDVYEHGLDALYRPRLRALRQHHKGTDRCFIIGNGPSLNHTDLSLLKDEVCIAVNGFFLKMPELDWFPTFYLVEDHLVAEDRAKEIGELQGPIKLFPAYLAYCMKTADDTIFFNHRPRKSYPDGFDFSTDAAQVTYTGCTVTFTALQLACYFGFKHIHLIGVDADYDVPQDAVASDTYGTGVLDMGSDDPNHFHPDYFGKGYRWHDPQVDKMVEAYKEAEKVTREHGESRIFNATRGGRLEVFERTDYNALLEAKAVTPDTTKSEQSPKILLIDMTRCGGGSATGELKSVYLGDWPPSRLMHVYSAGHKGLRADFGSQENMRIYSADEQEIYTRCEQFEPDVVIYRPVADKPDLHAFAMRAIARLDKPHIIWMMDDWPRRLHDQDSGRARAMDHDLQLLCTGAAACWAISPVMAGAFGARYGGRFAIFRNAVHLPDWPGKETRTEPAREMVLRYAGGLAPDMTLQSIRDAADAVALVRESGIPLRLEILTQQHWLEKYGHFFSGQPHIDIAEASLTAQQYREWIMGADMLLVAYNADPDTLKYVRYSFANKLPECLASGVPVLACGPGGIETLDFLERTEAAIRVARPGISPLAGALKELAENAAKRRQLGDRGRQIARCHFDREKCIAAFTEAVTEAALKKAGGLPATPLPKPEKRKRPGPDSHGARLFRFLFNRRSLVAVLSSGLLGGAFWLAAQPGDLALRLMAAAAGFIAPLMLWALMAHIAVHQNRALERMEQVLENLKRRQEK